MNQVDTDIARYSETMPQYREALDFLRRILDFKMSLTEKIVTNFNERLPDLQIESAVAYEKWQAGRPLFENESLPISAFSYFSSSSISKKIIECSKHCLGLD